MHQVTAEETLALLREVEQLNSPSAHTRTIALLGSVLFGLTAFFSILEQPWLVLGLLALLTVLFIVGAVVTRGPVRDCARQPVDTEQPQRTVWAFVIPFAIIMVFPLIPSHPGVGAVIGLVAAVVSFVLISRYPTFWLGKAAA